MRTRLIVILCLVCIAAGALIGHALMDRDLAPLRPAEPAVNR